MKESEKSQIFSWHCNLTWVCLGQSYSLPMSYQPSEVHFINSNHSNPNLKSNLDNHQLKEYSFFFFFKPKKSLLSFYKTQG